jgi:hypothetical protein
MKTAGSHKPTAGKRSTSRPQSPDRRHFKRRRLEYCDCGNLAVTVLRVRVGSDPQYIIRMPLCPACLKLEQELEQDLK